MSDGKHVKSYMTILQWANDDLQIKKRKEKDSLDVPLNELDPIGHLPSHLYIVQAFPQVLNTVT